MQNEREIIKAINNSVMHNDLPFLKIWAGYSGWNPASEDNNAVVTAVSCNHVEMVGFLLSLPKDRGVDPSVHKNLALRMAVARNYKPIVKILLNDPLKRVDPSDDDNSAIITAASDGNTELVSLLLTDDRVDVSARNNEAVDGALRGYHLKIVKMLANDHRFKTNSRIELKISNLRCKFGEYKLPRTKESIFSIAFFD